MNKLRIIAFSFFCGLIITSCSAPVEESQQQEAMLEGMDNLTQFEKICISILFKWHWKIR